MYIPKETQTIDITDKQMYEYSKGIFGEMEKFPKIASIMENAHKSKTKRGVLGLAPHVRPAKVDGLFVREIKKTDSEYKVFGEFNVVSPSQSLTARIDIYARIGNDLELIKQGQPFYAFGGAQKVIADNVISHDQGAGKEIVAVLSGVQIVKDTNPPVVLTETVDLGSVDVSQAMLSEITVIDPVSKSVPPKDHIYICYNRRTLAKETEDYFVPKNGTSDFYIPLKGRAIFKSSATVFSEVLPPNEEKAPEEAASQLLLSMRGSGGGVIKYDNTHESFIKAFAPYEERDDSGAVIRRGFTWDFGETPWVTSSPFTKSQAVDADFNMVLIYKIRSDKEPHSLIIRSYSVPSQDAKEIPFMRIYWGCLLSDTIVAMADGTDKKICDIRAGDVVKSSDGLALSVSSVIKGVEHMGVFQIQTSAHEVCASEAHPIITKRGVVAASEIIPGSDSLLTIDGVYEKVTNSVLIMPKDMTVFNLILDDTNVSPEKCMFYAGGILVGDNNMQKQVIDMRTLKMRMEYGLSEDWREDVENADKYYTICNKDDIIWKTNLNDSTYKIGELPPYITLVECRVMEDGKMKYHVEFDTDDEQTSSKKFTIVIENSDGTDTDSVELIQGQMAGDIIFDVLPTDTYYIFVKLTDYPKIRSEYIIALDAKQFVCESIAFKDEYNFDLLYACNDLIPKKIVADLEGSLANGRAIYRGAILEPFSRHIDLRQLGMEQAIAPKMTVCASYEDNDATVVFYANKIFDLSSEIPVVDKIEIDNLDSIIDEVHQVSFTVAMTKTLYEGQELILELFRGTDMIYLQDGIAAQSDNTFSAAIPHDAFCDGLDGCYHIRFRLKNKTYISMASAPHRLVLDVPVAVRNYFSIDNNGDYWVNIHFNKTSLPHTYCLSDVLESEVFVNKNAGNCEIVSFKLKDKTETVAAYVNSKVRGQLSKAITYSKRSFYIFQTGGIYGICSSDTPVIDTESDITVSLESTAALCETDTFSISGDGSLLVISKSAWDLEQGRDKIKDDYIEFIKQLEAAECLNSVIKEIRQAIAVNLPQAFEEFPYYNYRFDDSYEGHKSTIELFPGLMLEVYHSAYQHVVDTKDSVYINGYVASQKETLCVTEIDGNMCLDPFLARLGGGEFVDLMEQPTVTLDTEGDVISAKYETAGGAAIVDIGSKELVKPYVMLSFHSKLPRVNALVNPVMSRNAAFIAAETFSDISLGRDFFFMYNATNIPNVNFNGAYLRGRAYIRPCVNITAFGEHKTVPLFTTFGDICAEYGVALADAVIKRGKSLILPAKTTDCTEEVRRGIFLHLGDEILTQE